MLLLKTLRPIMKLIKSQRNGFQLITNNYVYEKRRITRTHQVWRCINKECVGQGATDLNYELNLQSWTLTKAHNLELDVIMLFAEQQSMK
jgi:hypothetical protein